MAFWGSPGVCFLVQQFAERPDACARWLSVEKERERAHTDGVDRGDVGRFGRGGMERELRGRWWV